LLSFFLPVVFCILPSHVFSYDSSPGDFKKFISALEQQSSLWMDRHKTGSDILEYYGQQKQASSYLCSFWWQYNGNCILFFGSVHGDELRQSISCSACPVR